MANAGVYVKHDEKQTSGQSGGEGEAGDGTY